MQAQEQSVSKKSIQKMTEILQVQQHSFVLMAKHDLLNVVLLQGTTLENPCSIWNTISIILKQEGSLTLLMIASYIFNDRMKR